MSGARATVIGTACLLVAAGCGGGGDGKPAAVRTSAAPVSAELTTARGLSVRISARRSGGKICTDQRIRIRTASSGYSEVTNRFCQRPGEPGTAVKATVFGRPPAIDGETIVYDSPERCRLWQETDALTRCTLGNPAVRLTLISGREATTLDDGHTHLELPVFRCPAGRTTCARDIR
jgi:hypothetical protein